MGRIVATDGNDTRRESLSDKMKFVLEDLVEWCVYPTFCVKRYLVETGHVSAAVTTSSGWSV
jgi:hypothetical protein